MSTNACSSTFIFSVLISVFPWFSMKVIVTWWFFVPAWVSLKLWRGVFSYNLGMENLMVQFVFNEHHCMYINFHLFNVDQCVSLIFYEIYSTWWFFVPAWMTLKLSKGVLSYNFGMENLMVQSVFNVHQWIFINFYLFSVDQCVFFIFHKTYSYLMIFCANMSDIYIMKRSVFIQFLNGEFNGAICF